MKAYILYGPYPDVSGEEREIIGIFTSEKELALALYQHRKEFEVDIEYKGIVEIIEEYGVMELPHCLSTKPMHFFRGNIIDYELNIDYSNQGNYRLPSSIAQYSKDGLEGKRDF